MDIIVRPATKADLASIKALQDEMHDYEVDPSKQWQHFENNSDRDILLADRDGNIVGMVVVNVVFKLSKVMVYLDELVVLESERGGGVGSRLMKAAEEWSWDHGADIIDFSSRGKHLGAIEFYKKLGYDQRDSNLFRKKREGYDGSS